MVCLIGAGGLRWDFIQLRQQFLHVSIFGVCRSPFDVPIILYRYMTSCVRNRSVPKVIGGLRGAARVQVPHCSLAPRHN
jgi:hypothetical protein